VWGRRREVRELGVNDPWCDWLASVETSLLLAIAEAVRKYPAAPTAKPTKVSQKGHEYALPKTTVLAADS
jgi:hypothetical protein